MEDSTAYIKKFEAQFGEALASGGFNTADLLADIGKAHDVKAYNAEKAANTLQEKLIESKDIDGLIALLSLKAEWNKDSLAFGQSCRDALGAISTDRSFLRMIQNVKFGKVKPTESLRRLAILRSLKPGNVYFDKTWGLGEVKGLDNFNQRVNIDFFGKPGHSMSFEYAAEALKTVPEDHLLVQRHRDPEAFAAKVAGKPGEIVRSALESFGPSSIGRLQMLLDSYGVVPEGEWKAFWSKARAALAKDKKVSIPAKRSDPLTIVKEGDAADFGDAWFDALQKKRNIPEIFADVSAYEKGAPKGEKRSEKAAAVLSNRLLFAIKGAFLFPPPMFTRLVLMAQRLGIETSKEDLAEMLLDDDRFMMAGDKLPAAEAKEMIEFIATTRPDAVGILFDRIPQMGYTLLKQMMANFWGKSKQAGQAAKPAQGEAAGSAPEAGAPAAEAAPQPKDDTLLKALQDRVRDLLSSPSAPATLVVWTLRENKWDDLASWKLPSLYELLDHAIAICEDKAAKGETLQMQHLIRDLFVGEYMKKTPATASGKAKDTWFASVFRRLEPLQQEALFMRLQSNQDIAEPRYQRKLAEAMIAINKDLSAKRASSFDAAPEQVVVHYTSWRSFKARQEEFRRLVEEEIPKNTQDISYARSLGDLRENAEYQYAKDQQRILLARREKWGAEIDKMHGTTFAEFTPSFETVEMATSVTIAKADGSETSYSILGEWDNDDALRIIPCGSRLAQILIGRKVGETVSLPSGIVEETATIKAIGPLPAAVREWVGQPAE